MLVNKIATNTGKYLQSPGDTAILRDRCPLNKNLFLMMAVGFTLQQTNISHLGKRKFIFKCVLGMDMLVPGRVVNSPYSMCV